MDSKIIIGVLGFGLAAMLIGLWLPSTDSENIQSLPWQIEHTANNSITVFGLTLGDSTLQDAERRLDSQASISLFTETSGARVVEAYFDKVVLGGLSAQMVLVMDLSTQQLNTMFQRGSRIIPMGGGRNRVTLSLADSEQVRRAKISSIAYLPRVALDDALLQKRFGQPAQLKPEFGSEIVHWLYPQIGLDIAINSQGHAVLQYVAPEQFTELTDPLNSLTPQ